MIFFCISSYSQDFEFEDTETEAVAAEPNSGSAQEDDVVGSDEDSSDSETIADKQSDTEAEDETDSDAELQAEIKKKIVGARELININASFIDSTSVHGGVSKEIISTFIQNNKKIIEEIKDIENTEAQELLAAIKIQQKSLIAQLKGSDFKSDIQSDDNRQIASVPVDPPVSSDEMRITLNKFETNLDKRESDIVRLEGDINKTYKEQLEVHAAIQKANASGDLAESQKLNSRYVELKKIRAKQEDSLETVIQERDSIALERDKKIDEINTRVQDEVSADAKQKIAAHSKEADGFRAQIKKDEEAALQQQLAEKLAKKREQESFDQEIERFRARSADSTRDIAVTPDKPKPLAVAAEGPKKTAAGFDKDDKPTFFGAIKERLGNTVDSVSIGLAQGVNLASSKVKEAFKNRDGKDSNIGSSMDAEIGIVHDDGSSPKQGGKSATQALKDTASAVASGTVELAKGIVTAPKKAFDHVKALGDGDCLEKGENNCLEHTAGAVLETSGVVGLGATAQVVKGAVKAGAKKTAQVEAAEATTTSATTIAKEEAAAADVFKKFEKPESSQIKHQKEVLARQASPEFIEQQERNQIKAAVAQRTREAEEAERMRKLEQISERAERNRAAEEAALSAEQKAQRAIEEKQFREHIERNNRGTASQQSPQSAAFDAEVKRGRSAQDPAFNSNFRSRIESESDFDFKGQTGSVQVGKEEFKLHSKLSNDDQNVSKVFTATNSQGERFVVKQYKEADVHLFERERVLTEYYKKNGIPVSENVRYVPESRTVIKEYMPGQNANPSLLLADNIPASKAVRDSLEKQYELMKERIITLNNSTEGRELLKKNGIKPFTDIKPSNFRYIVDSKTNEIKIILLDP